MHLGNSIICPVTGIPMLAIAAGTAFWAFNQERKNFSKDKVLPVVTLTALVFGLQMINFAIPETGSSGHIVGAILLAALLGPYAAFLAICAILLVQSIFFADGGLLALGCNIFNMGILACFAAYPYVFKPLSDRNRPVLGGILASIAALQLGSIAVVIEGALSGSIAASSLGEFARLMQAIHLPIGIVEGVVSGIIVAAAKFVDMKKLSYEFGGISVVLAGVISNWASQKPDGLEWSLLNISDSVVEQTQGILYTLSEAAQAKTAIFSTMPLGNLAGLAAVALIIYIAFAIMNKSAVKENVQ